MRQFFSFAFLSAISYLCHRVFDKSKWNTKDTAFKVDKSLPRLLPYAVCQIVRFDWNFCHQKVRICLLRKDKSMLRKSGNIRRACPAGGLKPFFGGGWDRKNYSEIIPEPTSSLPSYHAANCPGVMPRWGVSKRM